MLRICRGAAVAAGQDLPVGEEALRENSRRARNSRREDFRCLEFQLRTLREMVADALHVVDHRARILAGCPGRAPSCGQNVALPHDARWIEAVEQHGIETAGRLGAEPGEIDARGGGQACTLRGGDAGARSAEGLTAAQANFHEHQRRTIARDQVDLAAPGAEIAGHDREASARAPAAARAVGGRVDSARAIERHQLSRAVDGQAPLAHELPPLGERDAAGGAFEDELDGRPVHQRLRNAKRVQAKRV